MTRNEVVELLKAMTAGDGRDRATKATVDFWCAAVGDLAFGDAMTAVVLHFRESDRWIGPSHVRDGVKAIRRDRLERTPMPEPPEDIEDDGPRYVAWLAEQTERIASGAAERELHAIEGGRA